MSEDEMPAGQGPGPEPSGPASDCGPPNPRPSREQFAQTSTTFNTTFAFHGRVDARGGTIGVAAAARRPRRRATGKLDAADVDAALRCYVTPLTYDEALVALLADHVVMLEGETGSGRASGAIALLREVTDRTLIVLPPVITIKQLAKRTYDATFAYVVIDRTDEGPAADIDHTWRMIRDQVRDVDTFLVVTTAPTAAVQAVEAVRRVPWPRPPLRGVLRAHLAESDVSDEDLELVLSAIPTRWGMTSVARLAERISAGDAAAEALEELEVEAAKYVRAWFDGDRSRREILGVAALAFVAGAGPRTFEAVRTQLENEVASLLPARKKGAKQAARGPLPDFRLSLASPDGLIAIETVTSGPATRQSLAFKVPGYRRHVLAELWARYEAPFWDAMRAWLNGVIVEYDSVEIAYGLFLLAGVNLDEVQESFLEPWSKGERDIQGVIAATYVLWWMCYDDTLARIALQTAVRWTNDGDLAQRWTAALAFSGELGVRYPTDVARRLWQLITSGDDVSEPAQDALATLFVTLVDGEQDASVILTMLDRHMSRFGRRGADDRMLTRTMTSVLKVLAARDARTGKPTVFTFLHSHPTQARLVARLWARALRHSRYRREALQGLWEGLRALEHVSAEPLQDARILGTALAQELPAAEHETLRKHLTITDQRAHRRDTEALVNALLDALGPAQGRSKMEAEK